MNNYQETSPQKTSRHEWTPRYKKKNINILNRQAPYLFECVCARVNLSVGPTLYQCSV